MFINKLSYVSVCITPNVNAGNPLPYYLYMKTRISVDFQIYISVPLKPNNQSLNQFFSLHLLLHYWFFYHTTAKKVIFKNFAPLTNCISKINNTQIDNVQYIDIAIPMHSLLEYSDNYSKTSGNL